MGREYLLSGFRNCFDIKIPAYKPSHVCSRVLSEKDYIDWLDSIKKEYGDMDKKLQEERSKFDSCPLSGISDDEIVEWLRKLG